MNFVRHPRLKNGRSSSSVLVFLFLLGTTGLTLALRVIAQDGTIADQQASAVAPAPSTSSDGPYQRLREGTELTNLLGIFKPSGERIVFQAANGKGRFLCLENLNLERVSRLVRDNPESLQWEVSGTVTEFGGGNYLSLSRALLRSKTRSRKAGA